MPKTKADLQKVTMNFRPGDMEKMGDLFPDKPPSVAIRDLVSAFVDKHYQSVPTVTIPVADDKL